jgi:putative ABC transport system permease protein
VVVTTWGYDTELFRVPVVIGRGTLAVAAGTVLAAAGVTAVGLARAVGRLDLVAVLKARD